MEQIRERLIPKSIHDASVQYVRIDVISTLWQATTRELYDKTWIVVQVIRIVFLILFTISLRLIPVYNFLLGICPMIEYSTWKNSELTKVH